jgi:hypothetical protein
LFVGCKNLLHMRTFYALIGYARAIYHLTYHNKNAKYISTRKYMHAETLALLTKPLYFPNMKF